MKILALFPGQGSQKVGMGKELLQSTPKAKELFDKADKALGFSLSSICFDGPAEKLTLTEIAQPAILTVSVICFEHALSTTPDLQVVAAAGHSLGEYSALVAAGSLKFEDAVRIVNQRGKFMQEAVPVGTGKMVVVLGQEVDAIEAALSSVKSGVAQIANINAPGQVVVAGAKAAVDEFVTNMAGAKVMELNVSAPFHCALMKPAEEKLRTVLREAEIAPARFPVYANFSSKPLTASDEIRESLAQQVCGKVRWVECMQNAIRDCTPQSAYEFGNGNVLTGLLKRIDPQIARVNIS